MAMYTSEEQGEALSTILDMLNRCEKAQPGFAVGSPQHSLLKNRINALRTASALLTDADAASGVSEVELLDAIPPISSIIRKSEKAQCSFSKGSHQHIRLNKMIKAMRIIRDLMLEQVSRKGL